MSQSCANRKVLELPISFYVPMPSKLFRKCAHLFVTQDAHQLAHVVFFFSQGLSITYHGTGNVDPFDLAWPLGEPTQVSRPGNRVRLEGEATLHLRKVDERTFEIHIGPFPYQDA